MLKGANPPRLDALSPECQENAAMALSPSWRTKLLGSLQGQLQLATYLAVFLGFTSFLMEYPSFIELIGHSKLIDVAPTQIYLLHGTSNLRFAVLGMERRSSEMDGDSN